jgi:3-oxoacyl-[acyl-carrier-protein] synthase III
MYARLTGTGSCLPGNPVTNDDLAARGIDTNDEWIVTRTGIRSRYLASRGRRPANWAWSPLSARWRWLVLRQAS